MKPMTLLTENQRIVLNNLQGGFPVKPLPFMPLGKSLGMPSRRILRTLKKLDRDGLLSRFGAVLNTRKMGGDSRLAAMEVPEDRLDALVDRVNGYRTVTHNYRRSHDLNLWFVLSASDGKTIDETVESIQNRTGLEVYNLPKLTEYYVGLKFQFDSDGTVRTVSMSEDYQDVSEANDGKLTADQRDVIVELQEGLPLVRRPYRELARRCHKTEDEVLGVLKTLLEQRKIKRLGCVPDHYALGIHGNGMAVFDVPDEAVDTVGNGLGERDEVTHCYERPRHGEKWPFNLFAMVHERNRPEARRTITRLRKELDIQEYPHEVLFSEELYKKTGLRLTPVKND